MFPAALGAAVLLVTRRAFPLTPLVYWLVLAHCIVLMVGGHYTYANVPLFDSIAEAMGHTRNNYDKLGHIMQGLVPALIARELLIRKRGRAITPLARLLHRLLLSCVQCLLRDARVVGGARFRNRG